MFYRNGIFSSTVEDDNVLAQAVQFFLAGFETTSSTIAYTLYELCLNKDIQKKLRSDIRSKMHEHNGITYEALQDMKYLNQVVSGKSFNKSINLILTLDCFRNFEEVSSVTISGSSVYRRLQYTQHRHHFRKGDTHFYTHVWSALRPRILSKPYKV